MTETTQVHRSEQEARLHVALELSEATWLVRMGPAGSGRHRDQRLTGGAAESLVSAIGRAKRHFGLPPDAPVLCCYEAGRDGFWIHRYLARHGIEVLVVDAASIESRRRRRQAKTDRIDVASLFRKLGQWADGDRDVWHVVRVPTVAEEDRRRVERERAALVGERTRHGNRIRGLLKHVGITPKRLVELPAQLAALRDPMGDPVPDALRQALLRLWERYELVERQIRDLEKRRRTDHVQALEREDRAATQIARLEAVRSVGEQSAFTLVHELTSWRPYRNRREAAAFVGLAATPYASGAMAREQGISRTGSPRLRALMVELAWSWLRWQPQSRHAQWFQRRFGQGRRHRRVGIVALARRLLIDLWRYADGAPPPADWSLKGPVPAI